ncbi:hypothetical protein THAOC_12613, partial [Thalassiosira oceanica]
PTVAAEAEGAGGRGRSPIDSCVFESPVAPHESARHGVGAAEDGEATAGDAGLGSRLSGSTRTDTFRVFAGDPRQTSLDNPWNRRCRQSRRRFKKPPARAGSCGDVHNSPVSPSAAKPDTADTNDTSTNKATAFSVSTTSGDGFLGSSVQTFASIYGFVANWAIQPGLRTLNV